MKRQVFNRQNNSVLFGIVCAVVVFAFQTTRAHAQLTELAAFLYNSTTATNYPQGAQPMAELIQGADGNYYTTTNIGGLGACPGDQGCGAVVKIIPAGGLSVLYSFPYDSSTSTAPNGSYPQAGLVQGKDGNFYGVTTTGGNYGTGCTGTVGSGGCGTVFKLTKSGTLTVLHAFCGGGGCSSIAVDGAEPTGRMVFATNGDLYGTTQKGGVYNGFYNQGTIFRITTSGTYEVLHVFTGNQASEPDGASPVAGLTLGSDGNFYGTTEFGGASGYGSIFKMTPSGTVTLLHSFVDDDPNGQQPRGALVEASDGNLYGTCYAGGANGSGTVFRTTRKGVFTRIYDFAAEAAPGNFGNFPRAGLIQASDGNLYGTAWDGGAFAGGSIYQITTAGVAALEASFDPSTTGFQPLGALVQGDDGKLYVTLPYDGGSNGSGVQDQGAISVLDLALAPPPPTLLKFSPTSGAAGTKVLLEFGPYVGATSVTFNGTQAAFTVEGSQFIVATVPADASTGLIKVTTPGGTATSTTNFTVP